MVSTHHIYENAWVKVLLISSEYVESYSERDYNVCPSVSFPIVAGFNMQVSTFKAFVDTNSILVEDREHDFVVSKIGDLRRDVTLSFELKSGMHRLAPGLIPKHRQAALYDRHPKFNTLIKAFVGEASALDHLERDVLLEYYLIENMGVLSIRKEYPINLHDSIRVEKAKEYIYETYMETINLHEIATKCHLSVFHFSRLFKRYTGYTPYDFLLKTRIEKAKDLLRKDDLVRSVAFSTGFNSLEHFSFSFRKQEGLSPMAYKRARCLKSV
jgi:AraC-like DNA-binding protein